MAPTPYEIRILSSPTELTGATRAFQTALLGIPFPKEDPTVYHEDGRTLGALDNGEVVGTTRDFSGWMTVPGGARLPHAAVTGVGVLPTHTRRGIVSGLLTRQLQDIAARGEPLASLRASEAVIYERFGYGIATRAANYAVARKRATLRPGVAAGSPVRLADPDGPDAVLRKVSDRVNWVGSIARYGAWWDDWRNWSTTVNPRYLVLSGEPGLEDGFASYHPSPGQEWFKDRKVVVDDLVATTPEAYIGLLRFFTQLDLTETIELASRPVDEPLSALLVDARAVRLSGEHDETWLRLIDVEAALAARSYRPGADLVIAVEDRLLPANTGAYRISRDGAERTAASPDLSLDVAALASVYLGGERWSALALAGRVQEHQPGAVADADQRFALERAPFAGTSF